MNYETVKMDTTAGNNVVNDAALPAYHIYVRTPGGDGMLAFEPYYYLGTDRRRKPAARPPHRVERAQRSVVDLVGP